MMSNILVSSASVSNNSPRATLISNLREALAENNGKAVSSAGAVVNGATRMGTFTLSNGRQQPTAFFKVEEPNYAPKNAPDKPGLSIKSFNHRAADLNADWAEPKRMAQDSAPVLYVANRDYFDDETNSTVDELTAAAKVKTSDLGHSRTYLISDGAGHVYVAKNQAKTPEDSTGINFEGMKNGQVEIIAEVQPAGPKAAAGQAQPVKLVAVNAQGFHTPVNTKHESF